MTILRKKKFIDKRLLREIEERIPPFLKDTIERFM